MPSRSWLIAALILSATAGVRGLSEAPQATAVVAGRVIDGTTGQPLAGAVVRLGRTAPPPGEPAGPPPPLPPHSAITNGRGQFVFAGLAAGHYAITSVLTGYLNGQHGQERIEGPARPAAPTAGQHLIDLTIRMWRYGVVAGTVRDDRGEPVPEVRVRALRHGFLAARPALVAATRLQATTDDRGVYRLSGVVPGDYVVAVPSTLTAVPSASSDALLAAYRSGSSSTDIIAEFGASPSASSQLVGDWLLQRPSMSPLPPGSTSADRLAVFPTTFHPTATGPGEAAIVRVGPGETRIGTDIQLSSVETFRVSGRVIASDGRPMRAGLRLLPVAVSDFDVDGEFATAVTGSNADGRFTFLGVPPGQYVVRVQRIPQGRFVSTERSRIEYGGAGFEAGRTVPPDVSTPLLWAETAVMVGRDDLDGIAVTIREGAHLRGTMEFRGAEPRPPSAAIQRIAIRLTRADGQPAPRQSPSTEIDPTGRFTTSQYLPGRYLLSASSVPAGWTLRSAVVAGRDIQQRPIEITGTDVNDVVLTFTTGRPRLSGAVRGSAARDAGSTVLVFPADVRNWIADGLTSNRARTIAIGPEGSFEVAGLLPGPYLAIAIDAAMDVDLQDPEFVLALARTATAVTLGEDGVSTVSLGVSTVSNGAP